MAIGPHGRGQRGILKKYPYVSGLTGETEKQKGRKSNLLPEEGSLVYKSSKKGIQTR